MPKLTDIAVHWVLVLLLLGQGLGAVALPCDMATSDSADHAVTGAADPHAGHHGIPSATENDEPPANCCDGGYCAIGGCVSLAALPSPAALAIQFPASVAPFAQQPTYLSFTSPGLYRPPVFA